MSDPDDCLLCPFGHYCVGETDEAPIVAPSRCPPGTFNNREETGYQGGCFLCAWFGYQCPASANPFKDNRHLCVPGYYCPGNRGSPTYYPCPEGTYYDFVDATKKDDCLVCPSRYYCPEASTFLSENHPVLCSKGYFCDLGVVSPCPAGTYNPTIGANSITYCIPCKAGFICEAAAPAPSYRCPQGFYCKEGTAPGDQIACPRGTFAELVYKGNNYWPIPSQGARFISECFALHPG